MSFHSNYYVKIALQQVKEVTSEICAFKRHQIMTHVRSDTHSYGQLGGDVPRASSCVFRVKVRRGAAQKARFEDVSTATIGQEATLVQVHLLPGCLEVQSHCTATRVESITQQA